MSASVSFRRLVLERTCRDLFQCGWDELAASAIYDVRDAMAATARLEPARAAALGAMAAAKTGALAAGTAWIKAGAPDPVRTPRVCECPSPVPPIHICITPSQVPPEEMAARVSGILAKYREAKAAN